MTILSDEELEREFEQITRAQSQGSGLKRFALFVRRLETREAEREKGEATDSDEVYRLKVKCNTYAKRLVAEGFDDVSWEVTGSFGGPIPVNEDVIEDSQAYADKVLEVAIHAPEYVHTQTTGQIAEETGIMLESLQQPGVLESILRAREVAYRIQWAEQMIQAANEAARKREEK